MKQVLKNFALTALILIGGIASAAEKMLGESYLEKLDQIKTLISSPLAINDGPNSEAAIERLQTLVDDEKFQRFLRQAAVPKAVDFAQASAIVHEMIRIVLVTLPKEDDREKIGESRDSSGGILEQVGYIYKNGGHKVQALFKGVLASNPDLKTADTNRTIFTPYEQKTFISELKLYLSHDGRNG